MKKEKFKQLLENSSTVVMNGNGIVHLKDSKNGVAIQFWFSHSGQLFATSQRVKQGVKVHVFPLCNLAEGMAAIPFEDSCRVLVNANTYEYAQTFKIAYNSERKTARVTILEWPEMGETLITKSESRGITAQMTVIS